MKENNKLDVAQAWVQGPAGVSSSTSPIMEEITQFHHYVIVYLKMSKNYRSLLSIVYGTPKTMVIDLPVPGPSNVRYLWNFRFTLAFVLAVQIVAVIFFF